MKCQKCGKEIFLPFRCPYCGGYFCTEHRLPENHHCPRMELARAPKKENQPIVLQQQKQHEYPVTYTPLKPIRKIHFSNTEIKHLIPATLLVIAIGLSSAIYLGMEFNYLVPFTVILTISFFVHEIAHKIAAQRMGIWAEFRLIFIGAVLTLISIISPFFKIISPGAVIVPGYVDRESMGKISIAGPLTNIIFSMVFLIVAFPFSITAFKLGATFNAWIALFNLIPFGMFDGFKVFLWKKAIWTSAFTASLVLTTVCYIYIL
jgi:Zn-dependent protease